MKKSDTTFFAFSSRVYFSQFLLLICLFSFPGCKKDTIETPTVADPPPVPDYRDRFVGSYSGYFVDYTKSWYPPPQNFTSYTEGPKTNYTIKILKVAGQGNDSLIYSNEILEVLPGATYLFNDTFLIRSNGICQFGNFYSGGQVQFFGDSLITNDYKVQGAQNNITTGTKFRGKK